MSRMEEFDDRGNLIHFRYENGYEVWREFDENRHCIHWKDSCGGEHWWKHRTEIADIEIKITKEEFDEIKSKKEENGNISRFEIMDI